MNNAKYALRIYNAKLLMSYVFVFWLVNDIVELELFFFCIHIFQWKGQIGQNMSSKINDILRRYHICIKVDSQRQCYKLFMSSFFVVWLVDDIVELELSFFSF